MSIHQLDFENRDKVQSAIEFIKMFEPNEGYYLAFSGGKDSIVCKKLLELSGVKFDSHYSLTTVDPPELVYFIKQYHKDVEIHYPERSMWNLIVDKKIPPTRMVRYCCQELKEEGGNGRFVVTGVRKAESAKRSKRKGVEFDVYGSESKKAKENRQIFLNSDNDEKRKMIETCVIKGKHVMNPIINWSDNEVWEFIKAYNVPYCKLYDQGFKRLGCIGCPIGGKKGMIREFGRYPKYRANYVKAFDRMIQNRIECGLETEWKNGEEVMRWWIGK